VALVLLSGCAAGDDAEPSPSPRPSDAGPTPTLGLTSNAFEPEGEIPTRHSCDGENVSPPLRFDGVSVDARTVALIMEDPDAPSGTVLHWTFWNLPTNRTDLQEDADIASLGGREGQDYRGPCPPDGEHRYFFYGYAVNGTLDLEAGESVEDLRAALANRTVQEASMFGTYCRPQVMVVGCVAPR
jgi:Raf kinase inhibitor-like YbhB/YbcL family protein